MHRYRIHGLNLSSALPLPDARPAQGGGDAVRVTCAGGAVPCTRDSIALVGDRDRATLYLPDVATFELVRGEHIDIVPHTGDPEALRTFLLGSAWAVLLHQRGLLPLHGCALAWRGRAWLFVGESGAGKSTLAAALLRAGARLVSDDVTAIATDDDGAWLWPGLQSMKLAPAAIADMPGVVLGPTHDGAKLRLVPEALASGGRLPLAAVVELVRGGASTLTPIRGALAATIAMRHTFRGLAAPMLGIAQDHLSACVQLANRTRFFRLSRPWDLATVDRTAAWLIDQD